MVYITKAGDTFDSIAKKELGDKRHTKELIEANIQYIFTVIFIGGIELQLPEIVEEEVTANINNLPPWRSGNNANA